MTIAIGTRANNLLDKRSRPRLFRMVSDESTEATLLADLAQRFGQSRVVVIHENSTFGASNLLTARTRLSAQMISIVREIEIQPTADATATRTALGPAVSAVVGADGKPTNVGAFIYLGSNLATLERVFTAAAALNITGSPYLWLISSVASSLTAAAAARAEFRGAVSLSHPATESQLAYDAVFAAARALDASYLSLANATLIAQALSAVRFNGQSGAVSFDSNHDRPAQYNIDNFQGGARVTVGTFGNGAITLNDTAVLFSTGERVDPVYPFVACSSLSACADCTLLTKCQWCGETSTCSLASAGAAVCTGVPITNPGFCPAECVMSAAPTYCFFPANMTIWSQQKPRCDSVNNAVVPPAFLRPEQANNCSAALARERPCQQLLYRVSCSASCQQCSANSTAQALPVCRSVCDPLIDQFCPLTKAACVNDGSRFDFICGPDSAPCTRTLIQAIALVEPPTTTTTTATATTPAPTTTSSSTTSSITTTGGTPAPATPAPATSSGPATEPTTEPVSTTEPVLTTEPVTTTTEASTTSTEDGTTTTTEAATTTSVAPEPTATTASETIGSTSTTAESTTGAATTTTAGGSVTIDPAVQASILAEQKKNTVLLYENENNLRIGIGVGIAAFVCCLILLAVCLMSRK